MTLGEHIRDLLYDNQSTFWKVFENSRQGVPIQEYPRNADESELTPKVNDALNAWETLFAKLLPGKYVIECWNIAGKAGTKAGRNQISFIVRDYQSNRSQPEISGIPGNYIDKNEAQSMVNRAVADALTAYKTETELQAAKQRVAELEREKRELEAAADSPINKFLEVVNPHVGNIFGAIFPGKAQPAAQLSGTDGGTEMEIDTSIMPEVQALVKMAADNPEKFAAIKNALHDE